MEQNKDKEKSAESLMAEWMKSSMNFWGDMAKAQSPFFPGQFAKSDDTPDAEKEREQTGKNAARQAQKTLETGSKIFQSFISTISKPENLESVLKGIDSVPDLMTMLTRQSWDSYSELQKQWMERIAKTGKQTKAYNFDDIDQETFKTLREIYENEFQKFLNIPSLGLTRFHQEKVNRLIDKSNLLHVALNEFLYLFSTPLEKTTAVMQEKLEEMAEAEEIHDDFNAYYNMWVKILEGHYMTLLKSPEYTQVMDEAIAALLQYKAAKEDMLCDVLRNFPVPTNRDMDELSKEIYLLKKKVRTLSRKLDETSPAE
ncbi:hypothetical protein DENIS_4600 [Desulfonema ishimotonii]|uniref:Poly(3-hydroxyalkanoate) polymerase subunit PhaE n=2 Tax=Desulfonema ishimotonii TaxID=45657 RepID=A0A401G2X4_9BACT|nr:hypothetical protein DENIS_4600 [Desulfonema ishimotonii]